MLFHITGLFESKKNQGFDWTITFILLEEALICKRNLKEQSWQNRFNLNAP